MKNTLVIALVGVATGATGFFAGRVTSGDTAAKSDSGEVQMRSPIAAYLPASDSRKSGGSQETRKLRPDGQVVLSRHDMSYALGKALAEANPVSRMAALTQLLSSLDSTNLSAALDVFKDVPIRPDNKHEYEMLLYSWARFDGAAAIKYASENLTARGISGGELRRAALSGWSSNDPEGAVAWLDQKVQTDATEEGKELESGKPVRPPDDYAAALIKGWAEKDPYAAAEYLQERFDHGRQREYLMGHIASSLIKDGPSSAVKWAESFDDALLKEEAFEELAEDWSSIDPGATGAWLAQHINEPYSKEAVEDLARGWAVKDIEAAVGWFESLDDGLTRGTGIYELMKIWAGQDTEVSGEWIASLPQGSISRDMGVKAYAAEISKDNPEAAVQWLDTIGSDEIRQQAAPKVLENWMKLDSESAIAWARENNVIPEEQLQKFQNQQAQMRNVIVNGESVQLPINDLRKGIQNELPADAVIQQLDNGAISISHDGQTFQLPGELVNSELPELRDRISVQPRK